MLPRWILALLIAIPALAAPKRIAGRVVDEAGQAVPGASVYVYYALPLQGVSAICTSCYRDCGKVAHVDARGNFAIDDLDPTLKFSLLATAYGYEPSFSEFLPVNRDATLNLRKRVAGDEARLVRGCVVDPEGKPLVGAVVARQAVRMGRGIGYGEIPGSDPLSVTDESGEFALRVPSAENKLDVRVRARNYAVSIARELVPGVPGVIAVTPGGTVTGRIEDHGRPLAGVAVTFSQPSRISHFYLGDDSIGTDEQGRFVMTGLANDTEYAAYVKMQDSAPRSVPIVTFVTGGDASTTSVGEIHAKAGRKVAGCVDGGDVLPKGTRVTLSRGVVDTEYVEVGADGGFAFAGVPNEPVSLRVRVNGYEPHEMSVPPSGDITALRVVLERAQAAGN